MIEVPLRGGAANAHQEFTMLLGDNTLDFTLNYVTQYNAWSLDISRDDVSLVRGAMLEPSSDIIKTYNAQIGKLVFVGEEVTLDNLGTANHLVWVSDDE